jgi:hypothetical protein
MFVFGRLLSLWAKGKILSSRALLVQRLLYGMAAILLMLIIATMLISILMLGLCYFAYEFFLTKGLPPLMAGSIIGGYLLIMIALVLGLAWARWLKTREIPREILLAGTPLNGQLHAVVEAFLNGYNREGK